LSIIHSKPDHLYANQSYFVSFPDVLDGSFDGGVEGSLVGESAIGEVPRTLFESGFISDLGLSTFGPSTLHFQNFSVSAFRFYPQGWDKVSSFQNAVGALATLDESEGRLAWLERSGGNLGSSGEKTEEVREE
jgi:hypothetical protein